MLYPHIKPIPTKRLKQLERYHEDARYKKWRGTVVERDGNKCQYPGCKYNLPIQVHHIKKYSKAIHLRFDPMNGICLCSYHHELVTGQEERWEMFFIDIVQAKYK